MYDEEPITIRVEGNTPPTLMELQRLVKGYIEVIEKGNKQFICNEEGKLLGLPYNIEATKFWDDLLRKSNPETNNSDILNGDIVILTGDGLLE